MENPEEIFANESEELYQNAPCGYLSILPDRTIVKINNVLLKWLGFQREEIVNKKKLTDLVSAGGKIFYETHHDPLFKMQGFVNELNYDLVRRDGTTFPCLLNAVAKKNENGKFILAHMTIFDITERKKYEQELLRAKKEADRAAKAKAQLLSVMSHEIRTPMNAIIGLSHLLLANDPKPDQFENLRILRYSAENLLALLNSILDYSKMEAGKLLVDETDFHLHDFLHGLINTLKIKAEEKGIRLLHSLDPEIPEVLIGDALKISQVLTNLIGNAIKFTDKGSVKILIELAQIEDKFAQIKFVVKDTGIGIHIDKLSGIFNEFEQASVDTTRQYGGTGLGLSISKKLLEILGSEINVQSELGKGSTFYFTLKLKISGKTLIRDSWGSKEIKQATLKGIKLLLAEDNSVNVLVITQFLKNWELVYDIASDGSEAVNKIKENDYDLVLMDLQMPVMSGYEAVQIIRALPEEKFKKLPIIALTASAIIGENHKIFRIGMDDFVSKPFDPKDLYEKVLKYGLHKITAQEYSARATDIFSIEKMDLLNFNKYAILADTDNEFLTAITSETIANFKIYKVDFSRAVLEKNVDLFNKCLHKIKLVIDVLEITQLEQLLKLGPELIVKGDRTSLDNFSTDLQALFDKIIFDLEHKLNQVLVNF